MSPDRTLQMSAHGLLLVVTLGAAVSSCAARRPPAAETVGPPSRPMVALDGRLASLPFQPRVTGIEEALLELGARPLEPARERTLAADTLVALESIELVEGEHYLVLVLGDGPDNLRLVVVGAHSEPLAHHIGLGTDAWVRFQAPRTERARIRILSATGTGRVVLLRHRLGGIDIDPLSALDAARATGLDEEFGRVDAEMRARGYLQAAAPSVGTGARSIEFTTVPPGECYAVVRLFEEGSLSVYLRERGEDRSILAGGEEPMLAVVCPSASFGFDLETDGSRLSNALVLYRRAVALRSPRYSRGGRWGGRWWIPLGAPVLLHQEGFELLDVMFVGRGGTREITLRGGECYAIAFTPRISHRHGSVRRRTDWYGNIRTDLDPVEDIYNDAPRILVEVEGGEATLQAPDALFWSRCSRRDELVRFSSENYSEEGVIELFRRVSEPLDVLTADRQLADVRSLSERSLALEGYVEQEQPFATWTGQEVRVEASFAAGECYALFADTPTRVEVSVRLGRWERRAAATGSFAVRFCTPSAGRHTVHVRAVTPLETPPNVRLYRRAAPSPCRRGGPSRPMHTRTPPWIGRGAPLWAQVVRLNAPTNSLTNCLESGLAIQQTLSRYASWGDLESGPIARPRGFEPLTPVAREGCREEARHAPFEWPPLESVERAAEQIAIAAEALDPLLEELNRYYQQRRYLDDGMARGRELHPILVGLLEAGACAHRELERDREAARAAFERSVLEELETDEGNSRRIDLLVRQRVFVLGRELLRTAYALLDGDPEVDAALYDARRPELEIAVNSLQAHHFRDCSDERARGNSHAVVAAGLAFSRAAASRTRRGMETAAEALRRALSLHRRHCPSIRP